VWINLLCAGLRGLGHDSAHGLAGNPFGFAQLAEGGWRHGGRELDEAAVAPGVGGGQAVAGARQRKEPHRGRSCEDSEKDESPGDDDEHI
jgi:hypothetical protein